MSLFRPKPLRRWQRWRRRKRTSGRSRRRSCGILHVRPPTTRRSTTTLTNVRRPPSWPFILSKSPLCISSRHFQPAGAAGPREPSFCPLFRRRGGHHIGKLRQEARLTREIERPFLLFLVSQVDVLLFAAHPALPRQQLGRRHQQQQQPGPRASGSARDAAKTHQH